jgi:iron-sulfur cluster assembly protein
MTSATAPRPRPKIITLTDAAATRVRDLMARTDRQTVGLRIGVKKGGCAGMEYTMQEAEDVRPTDEAVEVDGALVLIDPSATLFLLGSQMDYVTDKLSARFVFNNPNQTGACGCGESVSLTPAKPEAAQSAIA